MIFIIILCISMVFSEQDFDYNIKIKGVNAGEASLRLEPLGNDRSQIFFQSRSSKLIDLFYKLRDNVNMIVDSKDFYMHEIHKSIRQGKYKKESSAKIDYEKNVIYYNKEEIFINNEIYSPVSLIYYLINTDLSMRNSFEFQIFENGKIKNILIDVLDDVQLKVSKNFFNCKVLNIQVVKPNNEFEKIMSLYIDQSNNKIPVMIKSKIKQGEMILTIK